MIRSFLLSNWKSVGLGLIVLFLGVTIGVKQYQLNSTRTELAEIKANYILLTKAAKECSDSVSKMEAEEKRLSTKAADALNRARLERMGLRKPASILAHSDKPMGISDYEATVDLVNSAISGRLR